MCDCPVPLSMWWHYPEVGWIRLYDVTEGSNPAADAAVFNASGADAFAIGCDECRTQYAP